MNLRNNHNYICLSLVIYFALSVTLLVAYFINYNFAIALDPDLEALKQTLLNPSGAQPEPKEKMLFFGSVASLIISLLLLIPFVKKKFFSKDISQTLINIIHFINFAIVFFIAYKAFKAPNPFATNPQNSHDMIAKTNFDFYFIKSFLHKNFILYAFILFPLIAFITLYSFKKPIEVFSKLNVWSSKIVLVIAIILSLLAFGLCTFDFPYTFENKYDLNAVYYSVVQVFHGNVLLSHNFTNTYGLYPHFIAPLLELIGLSFSSFTTIMGFLLALCFFMIYWFLHKTISNKWFVLLSMCAVFYMSYVYGKVATNYDPYFAIHPIRWLFPCLLLALSCKIQLAPSIFLFKNQLPFLKVGIISLFRICLFFLFGFGILWNPDFGIFTFITLLTTIIFIDFDVKQFFSSLFNSVIQITIALASVVMVFIIYKAIISLFYDQSPDFNLMFTAIKSFAVVGYYMLPMPNTYHPWMLFALVYVIGWVVSINNFYNNEKNIFSISVVVLTVLGTLSLTYYQGRSHNWNLMVTNFEAYLLLGIFADKLYQKTRTEYYLKPVLALCLFFIAFAPFQVIGSFSDIMGVVSSKKDKQKNIAEENQLKAIAQYMKENITTKDSVLILSADHYQSLYHTLIHKPSAVNPGFVDLFTKEQYNNLVNQIASKNLTVFLEPNYYRPINSDILNVLQANYEIKNVLDSLTPVYVFTKKSNVFKPLLQNTLNTIINHSFHTQNLDNLKFIKGKKLEGKGISNFSLEFIFKPNKNVVSQLTKNATILSTMNDSSGFVIQKYGDNPNQYIFGTKQSGNIFNVELGKWNYLTINVANNIVSIFVNGINQSETLIPKTILLNNETIYVGSYNNQGAFFFGNISEIRISNQIQNTEAIQSISQKIKNIQK
jgi:hypothetical protein